MLAFGGVFALGQSQCLRGRDSRKEEDHLPKLASRMKAAFPRDPRPSSLVPRPSSLGRGSRANRKSSRVAERAIYPAGCSDELKLISAILRRAPYRRARLFPPDFANAASLPRSVLADFPREKGRDKDHRPRTSWILLLHLRPVIVRIQSRFIVAVGRSRAR